MIWMQLLLLAGFLLLVLYLLVSSKRSNVQAGVKLAFISFVMAGVYAVLRPDDLTVLANALGIDRGTDLLLYVLVVAVAFSTVTAYLHFRRLELDFGRLARQVAIQEAEARNGPPEVVDPG